MALTDSTVPYEILIRFNDDGTPRGAHVQSRRVVIMDGEVLKDDIMPAAPLDLAGFPTSVIMTDAARDALARVTTLEGEKAELIEQLETAGEQADELRAENEALATQVRDLEAEAANLGDRMSAAAIEKQILAT